MFLVTCGKRKALISQPIIRQSIGYPPTFRECVEALESVSTYKDKPVQWDSCTFESWA